MTVYVHEGLPGSGKTLRILSLVENILKEGKSPVYLFNFHLSEKGITYLTALGEKHGVGFYVRPDRPVDLHVELERDPKTNYVTLRTLNVEDGATIFIDEAQEFFRTRGMSKEPPPPFITMLETHRHSGYNIHFITQNFSFLDKEIRRICGEYIKYSRLLNASYCRLEFFGGIKENPIEQKQVKLKVERFRYPKHIYELYTSAVQHNMGFRIPAVFRSLFFALLVLFIALWGAYSSFMSFFNGQAGDLKRIKEQSQNSPSQQPVASPPAVLPTMPALQPAQQGQSNQYFAPSKASSKYSLGSDLPSSLDLSQYILYYSGYRTVNEPSERVIPIFTLMNIQDNTCFFPDEFFFKTLGFGFHYGTTYIVLYDKKSKHRVVIPKTDPPLCANASRNSLGLGLPKVPDLSQYTLYYSGYYRLGASSKPTLILQHTSDGTCIYPDINFLLTFGYTGTYDRSYAHFRNLKNGDEFFVPMSASPTCGGSSKSEDSSDSEFPGSKSMPTSSSSVAPARRDDGSLNFDNPASFGRHSEKSR